MNHLGLYLRKIEFPQELNLDNIVFTDCAIIDVEIDRLSLLDQDWFDSSLPVFDEIVGSAESTGHFLLFTCACGVADDAGWEPIHVLHQERSIKWNFKRDGFRSYVFDKDQYRSSVAKLLNEIKALNSTFQLEPEVVVFPESAL